MDPFAYSMDHARRGQEMGATSELQLYVFEDSGSRIGGL